MSRKSFPFETLDVWQEARALVKEVYESTRSFPVAESYGLAGQLKRASISIATNLAEGSGRASLKDQAHFSSIAYGSALEVACELIISTDLNFISSQEADPMLNRAHNLAVRIQNLRKSQLKRANSQSEPSAAKTKQKVNNEEVSSD